MNRHRKWTILISLIGAISVYSEPSHGAQSDPAATAEGAEYYLNGTIDGRSVPPAIDAIKRGIRRIRVRSLGGRTEPSIDLAEYILRYNVTVVVDGYCFSTCASHLLIASARPTLEPGAVIGFHQTMGVAALFAIRYAHKFDISKYKILAQRERAIYDARHVKWELIYLPELLIRPVCIGLKTTDRKSPPDIAAYTSALLWIPDAAALNALNLKIHGRLQSSLDEFLNDASTHIPNIRSQHYVFGLKGGQQLPDPVVTASLLTTPFCPNRAPFQ